MVPLHAGAFVEARDGSTGSLRGRGTSPNQSKYHGSGTDYRLTCSLAISCRSYRKARPSIRIIRILLHDFVVPIAKKLDRTRSIFVIIVTMRWSV